MIWDICVPMQYSTLVRDCKKRLLNYQILLLKLSMIKLNRRLWAKIERFARFQARKYKKISVITGVCGSLGHIKHNVNIPAYWYKIIFRSDGKIISFLAPNTNNGMSRAKIKRYLTTIKDIEEKCNIQIER